MIIKIKSYNFEQYKDVSNINENDKLIDGHKQLDYESSKFARRISKLQPEY